MSAHVSAPAWEKEHLWLYLLALGFDPEEAASGKISIHLRLGINLFDKPNKDAFDIVTYFLFSKLNKSHCNEIFRFCFPPIDKKADSEFRKHSCEWLRRISDECGSSFPPVIASLFLSPGGPKFIHLMFHFARYVILQHIKVDSSGTHIPYPEVVNSGAPDLNVAVAKYRVMQNRFLQNLKKEDMMIQELQKKAQFFSKRIRDLRHENVDLDKQLKKMERNPCQNESNTAENIEKVRSSWLSIMEGLALLQKEKEVVDSVVKGHVDQYALDGTNVSVSVPRLLLEKIEKEMHQFHIGNIYEAGRISILTIVQLLNKALEMLMRECQCAENNALRLDIEYMARKTKFQTETLLGLKSLRQKLKHEDYMSVSQSIAEKQQEWDLKWEKYLGQSPFHLIKDLNPALHLLPAMSPLSFTPTTEEVFKSSVFCQYPASVTDSAKRKMFQTDQPERPGKASESQMDSIAERIITPSKLSADSSDRIQRISEKGSSVETHQTEHSCNKTLKYKGRNPRPVQTKNREESDICETSSSVKEDPFKKEEEQLAEQVANVVVSESPQNTQGKGKELDYLIGSLISDPFLTKKQIPRTPENLITEIRSSWKKVVEAEENPSIELHATEATEDKPKDTVPAFRQRIDSSMACFMSSCMSDTVESPFLKVQSPFRFQEVSAGHSELPVHQTDEPLAGDAFCLQGLPAPLSDKREKENPEVVAKILSELDCDPEDAVSAESVSHYVDQNSVDTTLPWNASEMLSGVSSESHDVIQFDIRQETLPEDAGSLCLNSFHDLELDDVTEENSEDKKAFPDSGTKSKHKLDFQSILSRYEALKKTVLENSLTPTKQIPRCRSEFSLTPVSLEVNSGHSPLGTPYALDAEAVKTPSQRTALEKNVVFSPLIAFSPFQPNQGSRVQDRGDLSNKLKG